MHFFSIIIGHYIDEYKANPTFWTYFKMFEEIFVPSVSFLIEYLLLFLISCCFVHLIWLYLKKKSNFPFFFFYNIFTKHDSYFRKPTAIGQIFVSNLLLLFFIQQIISNNINTLKVIVNTQLLLDSKEKIYKTDKEGKYQLIKLHLS